MKDNIISLVAGDEVPGTSSPEIVILPTILSSTASRVIINPIVYQRILSDVDYRLKVINSTLSSSKSQEINKAYIRGLLDERHHVSIAVLCIGSMSSKGAEYTVSTKSGVIKVSASDYRSSISTKLFSKKRDEYKYIRDSTRALAGPRSAAYKLYDKIVQCMKDVDVQPAKEVLDEDHFNALFKLDIQPNRCWHNSFKVLTSEEFADISDEMMYCEGFADTYSGQIIEHGWLKYKDKYIDPTMEVVMRGKKVLRDYTTIIELPKREIMRVIDTTKVHGLNTIGYIAHEYNI